MGYPAGWTAAMEPAREERDDRLFPDGMGTWIRWPQWSPLVKSGMTSKLSGEAGLAEMGRNGARS